MINFISNSLSKSLLGCWNKSVGQINIQVFLQLMRPHRKFISCGRTLKRTWILFFHFIWKKIILSLLDNYLTVAFAGNSNDKVLYPRVPARIRSGYSAERLERRHSLRFFGHGRRSHSLQRTGSVRHISDKNEKVHLSKDVPSDEVSSESPSWVPSKYFLTAATAFPKINTRKRWFI